MSTQRFSGRQLTTIVVAMCAAVVLAPAGVMAASHSSVSIADGKHSTRLATVGKDGSLQVATSGTTTVRGSVTDLPGRPTEPFSASGAKVTVPAGKHLVVQTISVLVATGDTTKPLADLQYTSAGASQFLDLPLTAGATISNQESWVAAMPVTLYADPGSSLQVQGIDPSGDPTTTGLTVSGYLTG